MDIMVMAKPRLIGEKDRRFGPCLKDKRLYQVAKKLCQRNLKDVSRLEEYPSRKKIDEAREEWERNRYVMDLLFGCELISIDDVIKGWRGLCISDYIERNLDGELPYQNEIISLCLEREYSCLNPVLAFYYDGTFEILNCNKVVREGVIRMKPDGDPVAELLKSARVLRLKEAMEEEAVVVEALQTIEALEKK